MERNDYDRVANQVQEALATLVGNTHGPMVDTDSVSVTKDGWIQGVVDVQRAADYCRGLAEAHWRYRVEETHRRAEMKGQSFYASFDARIWADAWMETIEKNPDIPHSRDAMVGWFSNALMRGYDYAMTRPDPNATLEAQNDTPDPTTAKE